MVISDFGLCRKLELDESSFLLSMRGGGHNAPGSFGYRAPEVLRGEVDEEELVNNESTSGSDGLNGNGTHTSSPEVSHGALSASGSTASVSTLAGSTSKKQSASLGKRKLTRSIDIFSLGCIFYFVLTGGEHPFGVKYEREVNILSGKINMDGLSIMGSGRYEAETLIAKMCSSNPYER